MKKKSLVLVAMSGGVDSSVAAGLLLEQGFDVRGLTLRLGPSACGSDGLEAARRAATHLGIAHEVQDRPEFETDVLAWSWDQYARGRTPNPCVVCNRRMKFRTLFRRGRELGAQLLATGHYARLLRDEQGPRLARGLCRERDQSYFLFHVEPEALAMTCFPLGSLDKEAVREHARRMGLHNADRKDSQDACLASDTEGFAETLRRHLHAESRPGVVVDEQGQVLGRHDGIHRFTIGQRKGLGFGLGDRAYVIGLDPERAQVRVSRDPAKLLSTGLVAGAVSWLTPEPPLTRPSDGNAGPGDLGSEPPTRVEVQIRYRHEACPASLEAIGEGRVLVRFLRPQRAVTPGQAAVFYRGDGVLGGGFIDEALPCPEVC